MQVGRAVLPASRLSCRLFFGCVGIRKPAWRPARRHDWLPHVTPRGSLSPDPREPLVARARGSPPLSSAEPGRLLSRMSARPRASRRQGVPPSSGPPHRQGPTPERCLPRRALHHRVAGRPALREDCAHFFFILGAKCRRIEVQQGPIKTHQALPAANPLCLASLTSCVRRRASARATAAPNGVIR